LKAGAFSGLGSMWLKDIDARLVSVNSFDGLQGAQIVREWSADGNGLLEEALSALTAKAEWTPDADAAATGVRFDLGEQGAKRYVANPSVGGKQWQGLYVGGPVEVLKIQSANGEKRVLRQTLTRVNHAGAAWAVGSGGAVAFTGAEISAKEALKDCRCSVQRRGIWQRPYRTDVPPVKQVELKFRHWTHESRTLLEGLSEADMQAVVDHHLGDSNLWKAKDRVFEIDPGTNAGVFSLVATLTTSYAVEAVGDLATIPHRLSPATRETLRKFGMRSEDEGEGYLYGRLYRWENLARTAETVLQYPEDLTFLAAVVDKVASYADWAANGTTGAICKNDGRLWQYTGGGAGDTFALMLAAGGLRPWWRVIEYKLDEQEDGLLNFTALVEKPLWNGGNAAVQTSVENPDGWGRGRVDTVPSVPQAVAEAQALAATAPAGHVLQSVAVSEQSPGYADIRKNSAKVWDYAADAPAMADDAPAVTRRVVGPGDGGMSASFPRVAAASAAAVKAIAEALVVPDAEHFHDATTVRTGADGAVEIEASSTREAPHELPEHQTGGDYFGTVERARRFNQPAADSSSAEEAAGLQADGSIVSVDKSKTPHGNYDIGTTTEKPVARDWTTTHVIDALDGETRTVTVHHYRNQAEKPDQPDLAAGWRWSENFTLNRFGLWDGEGTISPHDVAWAAVRASVDYFGASEATSLMNRAAADATAAAQAVNSLTSVQRSETASGLHDSTVTVETGTPRTVEIEYLLDALGVASRTAKETSYRNQATQPTIPTPEMGRRVSASLQMNRLGSWDGTVQETPDDREKQSTTEEEDAFATRTATTTRNAAAASSAAASLNTGGELVSVRKSETLSGLHDTTVETVTPKAWSFSFTYDVKRRGVTKPATVYVYGNQAAIQEPAAPVGADELARDASWSMNRHGLYDGRVSFVPTFYTTGTSAVDEDWEETRMWVETSYRAPADSGGSSPVGATPADGYWWRLVTETAACIVTTGSSYANNFVAGGGENSGVRRIGKGLYLARKTALTATEWQSGARYPQ